MPATLAQDKTKFTILTSAPADPDAPTVDELNAGIDASDYIVKSDFQWTATDSTTIQEPVLSTAAAANTPDEAQFAGRVTVLNYFDGSGALETTGGGAVFQALTPIGTQVWCYARRSSKVSSAAWAAGDPIFLGGRVVTDNPQQPSDFGGYVKQTIPLLFQDGWPNITAAAGA